MREVLDHVVASVTPASAAQAAAARHRLARSRADVPGGLEQVAARLAGARHSPAPSLERKTALLVAADHGVAAAGVDFGANHPTRVALELIARGGAAVCSAARSAGAHLVLVDAGVRGGESVDFGPAVLPFRVGDGTADITRGPAMSADQALQSLQIGIALLLSMADAGLDVLALGALGPGGQPSSAALVTALSGRDPAAVAGDDLEAVRTALAWAPAPAADDALAALARFGGFEHGVLAGAILAAASINVPVVLDDHASSAAALVAARLAPAAAGYLFASHAGAHPSHTVALATLDLAPLFQLGLSHGEGTGAILALPMLDAAARVVRETT